MLGRIFKGKRKVQLHELVSEHSYLQHQKNLFLRRYILLIVCGILFMFWINGQFNHGNKWTYYFALDQDNKMVNLNENSVPQPFSRDDVLAYARGAAYDLFSLTPITYKDQLNHLFTTEIIYKSYVTQAKKALDKSGLQERVENGWYYTIKELGNPEIKSSIVTVEGKKLYAWQVSYKNFKLYGRKGDQKSEIEATLQIIVAKTPFMLSPNRLSVLRIFVEDLKDIGNDYGY
jgi:hypothetical protein